LLKIRQADSGGGIKGQRPAFSVMARQFIAFTVYERSRLVPGTWIKGPAIIEERESTIVIGEDGQASVDEYGFVWIDLSRQN
jgi:N-methylhydantoinase A